MPEYGPSQGFTAGTIQPRDIQQFMVLALWPPERINAAFASLKDGEYITVVAGDYVIITDGKAERRFYMVPPVEKKNCPTCGRQMDA